MRVSDLPLVLASASPRRRELLGLLGIPLEVLPPHVDERQLPGEEPREHVRRLAREKAEAAAALRPGRAVLGADTAVVLGGRIYGKPRDAADARRMLRELGGRTHLVLTGWAVLEGAGYRRWDGVEESRVTMRRLGGGDLEAYLATGESLDKAGAYAAQGEGGRIVERIEGSYSNVVGLPLGPVGAVLAELGYRVLDPGVT